MQPYLWMLIMVYIRIIMPRKHAFAISQHRSGDDSFSVTSCIGEPVPAVSTALLPGHPTGWADKETFMDITRISLPSTVLLNIADLSRLVRSKQCRQWWRSWQIPDEVQDILMKILDCTNSIETWRAERHGTWKGLPEGKIEFGAFWPKQSLIWWMILFDILIDGLNQY